VVENAVAVLFVTQKFLHLADVLPDLRQVQRPEILEEALIGEVLHVGICTLSTLKKKALGTSLGGSMSAR
jgi:hypothetical protein